MWKWTIALMLCGIGQATITITQLGTQAGMSSVANSNCGSANSCYSMTITSTTAGRAIVGEIAGQAGTGAVNCFDGGDTFTKITGAHATDSSGGSVDICYVISGAGSKTTFYVSGGSSYNPSGTVYSVQYTLAPLVAD